MELCEVGSILSTYEVLKKGLNEDQLVYVVHKVLKGLEYLHSTKRIHRDIKSGNVLLTEKGKVKIG
jgi:serine/threonine protein kinase